MRRSRRSPNFGLWLVSPGPVWWLFSIAALVVLLLAPRVAAQSAPPMSPEERAFLDDVVALTSGPHRLSGTEEGAAAARYIEERLRAIGFDEVLHLDMPVWRAHTHQCELRVGDRTLRLHPLRPNVVVHPVTPPDGITGPLVYAGRGTAREYGDRDIEGAIVVLEYDSFDAWELAFAYGAAAVVFVGDGVSTPLQPKHVGIPANRLRFYVSRTELNGFAIEQGYREATLKSRVVWERGVGRNLVVRVPGTDPDFGAERVEPEALVLAAHYDTYGTVPELSEGARTAGNVAALLEAAARLREAPPRRDVWLAFFDNHSRALQGAREFYATVAGGEGEAQQLVKTLASERSHLSAMRELLTAEGLEFAGSNQEAVPGVDLSHWLALALRHEADFARDDVRRELQRARLLSRSGEAAPPADWQRLEAQALAWDEVRRAMHQGKLAAFVRQHRTAPPSDGDSLTPRFVDLFDALERRTKERFDSRLGELDLELAAAKQRVRLRRALGYDGDAPAPWIALHVTYALAEQGARWGVVAGDHTPRLFPWRSPKVEGDSPGYYGGVFNAFREALPREHLGSFEIRTLDDPSRGTSFAPGAFVSSGFVAGAYGFYNVSLMTGHDARPRDGHPADTLERLDWWTLREQAAEATSVLQSLASSPALSLPAVFSPMARNKAAGWSRGQSTGDYVSEVVSGSLSEDRPANGALLALWPGQSGWAGQAWLTLDDADQLPAYDPIVLEPVNTNGRFHVVSLRDDLYEEVAALGALFDQQGQVVALSSNEKLLHKLSESIRVDLLHGSGGAWTYPYTYEAQPNTLKVLKASSNAAFRANRVLSGQLGAHGFFFVSEQVGAFDIKIFQPMGPVVLGSLSHGSYGSGVSPPLFRGGIPLGERTSRDLFELNESRLSTLRQHGVTSADLEYLHGRARRIREQSARAPSVAEREAGYARSAALSHRVYLPLRATMDDLVHAVVVLLLLSIPFAFAMERLLICATTIYGRIGGFTVLFLTTFGLLYWMHPGFAIASTPIIVFLAFAIVLLSSLVIVIVVRKFQTELRTMQGQQVVAHDSGVSHAATMLAAVNMGMSTMRRRPTRTLLTTVTVVMLTFTILLFASFNRTVGVSAVYEGPVDPRTAPSMLVRKLDYTQLPSGIVEMLAGQAGEGFVAPNYWLVRQQPTDPRVQLARLGDGESLAIDGVMGIDPEEIPRWPELARALTPETAARAAQELRDGGLFIPRIVSDALAIAPGDEVMLAGRRVRVAGIMDSVALQRLRHLDQQSVLPVDFQDPTSLAFRPDATQNSGDTSEMLLSDGPDRDFVHLSGDQVVVTSLDMARALGGTLHSVSVYPAPEVDAVEQAEALAEALVMPVWVSGPDGAERLVLTVLTEVTGGVALVVPLLLGGLIVFGTLLGSISDREKEIYTFSALGLSPTHVGVLFLAEAAVYAIVGGVGGQLLAQLVGLGLTAMANAGWVEPASINFSSSNALFAIGVVMATVLISAIYPAMRAAKSANPGLQRTWRMPRAEGNEIRLVFPFTVSAYDITGVVSFIAEHFSSHDDAGLGSFAASNVRLRKTEEGNLCLASDLALAPFDLGVTQRFELTAVPSAIEGVDEVAIVVKRTSGATSDWYRANHPFMRDLRRQFLLWRTLTNDLIEHYRMTTLQAIHGEPALHPHAEVPEVDGASPPPAMSSPMNDEQSGSAVCGADNGDSTNDTDNRHTAAADTEENEVSSD